MLETNYKIAENIFIGLTIEGLRTTYPEEMHQIALHNQTTTDLYYLRNLFNDPKTPSAG
ncbi:MAG: hypothetical protein HWD59_10845 [Coxiellaceae bacterium]|nr:MAG: hypothetical protein HWD59_10845 [Coxiellaceae bacterium]